MEDMLFAAAHRLEDLRERGFQKAAVYDPPGVGGTHVVFVLPHGDRPEAYGLPANPSVGPVVGLSNTDGVALKSYLAAHPGISVAERLRRKRKITRITTPIVSSRVNSTSCMELRMDCDAS